MSELCTKASAMRMHALQRGKPQLLQQLTESLGVACDSTIARLAAFVHDTAVVVASACDQALGDLHARLDAFTKKQVCC